jgi:hypothetical protein
MLWDPIAGRVEVNATALNVKSGFWKPQQWQKYARWMDKNLSHIIIDLSNKLLSD